MKNYLLNTICFVVLFLFIESVSLKAQAINPNGGFEESNTGFVVDTDVSGWTLYAEGSSTATFEVQDYEVYEGIRAIALEISALGSNAWDIQIVNEPFEVVAGTQYTYSVWAKADRDGAVANFTVGNPSYSEFGRVSQVVMTTQWQQVTFDFTVPAGNTEGRAPIHFSESQNNSMLPVIFYIDNLEITPTTVCVEDEKLIANNFNLEQNYPNPFNPETAIEFSLPVRNNVRLVLYDILGNMVKEIISGNFSAGRHRVSLNASGLTSGVYFYKLEAGNFVTAKKLILMK